MRYGIVTETYPPEFNGVALTVQGLEHGLRERGHRLDLVRLLNSQGVAQLSAGRYDEAEAPLERAAEELHRAFRQLPSFQAPWREREAVYHNLVLLHDRQAIGLRRAREAEAALLRQPRRELDRLDAEPAVAEPRQLDLRRAVAAPERRLFHPGDVPAVRRQGRPAREAQA